MLCACGCGRIVVPKQKGQIYYNAACRQRDKNRRWPVKRQSGVPVLSRDGLAARKKAQRGGVTPSLGEIAQAKPRTLLWEASGKFGGEFVAGVSRSVLRARGWYIAGFQLVRKKR